MSLRREAQRAWQTKDGGQARLWRRCRPLHILFALLATSGKAAAAAAPLPEIQFSAAVTETDGEPRQIHGELRVHHWQPHQGHCLYLPYADADYGEDRGTSRRFEMLSAKTNKPVFLGGTQTVELPSAITVRSTGTAQQVELLLPPGSGDTDELLIQFTATVPRLQKSASDNWFYDGFMPELLDQCQPAGLDPAYYRRPLAAHWLGGLQLPASWQYAGPGDLLKSGSADGSQEGSKEVPTGPLQKNTPRMSGDATANTKVAIDLRGPMVAFSLGHDYQKKEFVAGGVKITLLYHTPEFKELEATVSETLPIMANILGPYPFPSLTIVETSELQRQGLPGLIAMNKPAQAAFSKVQQSYLNWHHWIFTLQLAKQWYGGAVTAASPDSEWLISGIVEFVTLEALSRHPARFNLFNSAELGFKLLSFDYLQISEMSAALLRRSMPFERLTNLDYTPAERAVDQYPLLFMKQAFTMRQLKGLAGDQAFFGYMRNLTKAYSFRSLSPRQFADYLARLPSPFAPTLRRALEGDLQSWWTSDGWPDFALTKVAPEPLPDGRWVTQLAATQEGKIDFPPLFGVKDASGRLYVARGEKARNDPSGPWTATIVTPSQPGNASVDPTHETFDADRFNNKLGPAGYSFFPGGADTLRDDAYTVLWLPYVFRRPGEPFSVGIQAALFRYLDSSLLARIETAPGTKLTAVDLSDSFQLPTYGISLGVDLNQDYYFDRLAQAVISRSPFFLDNPVLAVDLALRHRERAGQPQTNHSTIGVAAHLHPPGFVRVCGYNLDVSYEKAPGALAAGFDYDRRFGVGKVDCNITNRTNFSARVFRGDTTGQGTLPQVALFNPVDLKESHLRLVNAGDWAHSIVTSNLDLYLPFFLPLPDNSLVLSRQMRWRLFYDIGRAYDLGQNYRSAGFGFLLPFGGDLAGAGSLAFTRLSLLIVDYNQVGSTISRNPSVLLDLTGDL